MKYLCLVYLSPDNWNACTDSDCFAYVQKLGASGHMLAGEALHATSSATTVRMRNGQTMVTDGPFAETKEHLAGFYMIEAKDLDEAIELAAHIPPAKYGGIEVRPIRTLDVPELSLTRAAPV
jgi:hypothetical protein